MRVGLALSVLLTAMIAGVGAGIAVLLEWSNMVSAPTDTSPALWAARAYLAYFDLGAIAAFVPCLTFCHWVRSRGDTRPTALFTAPPTVRREPEFPFEEVL